MDFTFNEEISLNRFQFNNTITITNFGQNIKTLTSTDKTLKDSEEYELEHDFLEKFFGITSTSIDIEKPLIILVKDIDELYKAAMLICREKFLEKRGRLPKSYVVEELRDIERNLLDIEHEIVTVRGLNYEEDKRIFKNILDSFISKDYGFLIIPTDNPWNLREKIINISPEIEERVLVFDKKISKENETNLFKILLGLDIKDEFKKIIRGKFFGSNFTDCIDNHFDERLRKELKKLPEELEINFDKVKTKDESDIHAGMKVIVWKYLKKTRNKEPILEHVIRENVVDIFIDDECYEIETFFKVSEDGGWKSKFTRRLKELEGYKVNFVLRNISLLINLKELYEWRNKMKRNGFNVEIYGIDIYNLRLKPISEFVRNIKELVG